MKKAFAIILALAMTASVSAAAPDGYDPEANYLQKMQECASNGSVGAMYAGTIYEQQRNQKIVELGLPHATTSYFTTLQTGEAILTAMKTDRLKSEHPTAGRVYEYLNKLGYPDTAIAGILGNMMAECGGQTLELDWSLYGGSRKYYGLCMWSLRYNPGVGGLGLDEQLDFLARFIRQTMDQFGGSFTDFCAIQDPGEAARYFCLYYERGEGIATRMENAYQALAWIEEM